MFIVDAQVHIWSADRPERPWRPNSKPHRDPPLDAEALLKQMDDVGVSGAILIPPFWTGPRNHDVIEAKQKYPDRFGIVGRLDNDPPPTREQIAIWRTKLGFLGIRASIAERSVASLEGLDWLWEEAQKAHVPIMILVPHNQMHMVDRIARQYPQLRLIMSHLGLVSHEYDHEAFKGLDHLIALAKRPNVAIKWSALPFYTRDKYPYKALHPYLRRTYDAFGPKRIFWGSDLGRMPCTYKQMVTIFTEEIPWLNSEDKEWIMGRGLCEWMDWRPEPTRLR